MNDRLKTIAWGVTGVAIAVGIALVVHLVPVTADTKEGVRTLNSELPPRISVTCPAEVRVTKKFECTVRGPIGSESTTFWIDRSRPGYFTANDEIEPVSFRGFSEVVEDVGGPKDYTIDELPE